MFHFYEDDSSIFYSLLVYRQGSFPCVLCVVYYHENPIPINPYSKISDDDISFSQRPPKSAAFLVWCALNLCCVRFSFIDQRMHEMNVDVIERIVFKC